MHSYALECTAVVVQALNVLPRHTRACVEGCVCVYCVPLSVCPAGSEPDWVLDLVATGFNKPDHLFGHSMRSKEDVDAAADAFKEKYTRVRGASRLVTVIRFQGFLGVFAMPQTLSITASASTSCSGSCAC